MDEASPVEALLISFFVALSRKLAIIYPLIRAGQDMQTHFYQFNRASLNQRQYEHNDGAVNIRFLMFLLSQFNLNHDNSAWQNRFGIPTDILTLNSFSNPKRKELFEFSFAQVIGGVIFNNIKADLSCAERQSHLHKTAKELPKITNKQYHEFFQKNLREVIVESITSSISDASLELFSEHGEIIYNTTHRIQTAITDTIRLGVSDYATFCERLLYQSNTPSSDSRFSDFKMLVQIYAIYWEIIHFYHITKGSQERNTQGFSKEKARRDFEQMMFTVLQYLASCELGKYRDSGLLHNEVFQSSFSSILSQSIMRTDGPDFAILYASIARDAWMMMSPLLYDDVVWPENSDLLSQIGKMLFTPDMVDIPVFSSQTPYRDELRRIIEDHFSSKENK